MRIRLVVLAVLSICLAPFLIGQIIGAQKERSDSLLHVAQGLRTSVNRASDFLLDIQSDVENIASIIALNDNFQYSSPERCSEYLEKIRSMYEKIEHISILTPKGTVFCSTVNSAQGVYIPNPGNLTKSVRYGDIFWGDAQLSKISKTIVIPSATAVKKNEKLDYIIVISLNALSLKKSFFDLLEVPIGKSILINESGQILDTTTFAGSDAAITPDVLKAALSLGTDIIEPKNLDENSSYIGVVKLPMNNSRIVLSTPLMAVYAKENQKLVYAIIISIIEVTILAITIMIAVELFFFRTLRKISALASEITLGGQGQRISIKSPFADFKVLASALNLMVERLDDASKQDTLTGLANRRALDGHLVQCDRRMMDGQPPLAIAMIDIDNFKLFNDRFGHTAGDRALQQIGKTLRAFTKRGSEMAARYGGEEFTLVLADTDPARLNAHLEALRRAVEDLNIPHPDSPFGRMTISIGYAITLAGMALQEAVELADTALYESKTSGRNRVTSAQATPSFAAAI